MIDIKKKQLRKEVKKLKASVSPKVLRSKSALVFDQIEKDQDFKNAKVVFVYWSLSDEVSTQDFINKWTTSKTILLPVIKGDILELRVFTGLENMKPEGKYHIQEPQGPAFDNIAAIDYSIIPGVAFDLNNNRMGRGKAFYDKLLLNINSKKVGVCFDFQIFDSIPIDKYDIKMDHIVYG